MKTVVLMCFVLLCSFGYAQDKKIDQLEVFYDQGYYPKVLRKASNLIALPEYDYSGLPSFYKSLALFRMSADELWFKRHNYAIDEAISAYNNFLENERISDYLAAHYQEIASLKTYLVDLETQFATLRLNATAEKIQKFRLEVLKGIKARPDIIPENKTVVKVKDKGKGKKDAESPEESIDLSYREKMVVYAKSLVGTKYKWAGNDPNGFDCSGFVGYVYKKYGIILPRTASAQLEGSKKVKIQDADQGDLLFFSSGSNISHVGLVISKKGEDLVMVHASTSKGVIITEIEMSTYWKPKLKACGTFI